jgi:hypothetical protein
MPVVKATRRTAAKRHLIEAVAVVTEAHGEAFANDWFGTSCETPDLADAVAATGIIAWPDDDRDLQDIHIEIVDAILAETLAVVKEQVADAFVAVANRVFERERRRPALTPRSKL